MITIETYLSPDEYEQLMLINLGIELQGSTDHDEKAPQNMIYRVEQSMINYLTWNYDFKESMIKTNDHTLNNFKQAAAFQVEWFIRQGLDTPVQVNEFVQTHKSFLCDQAIGFLRTAGMMNIKGGF